MPVPDVMRPVDVARFRNEFLGRSPLRWICIDDLLIPEFARELSESFPSFEQATQIGRQFRAVNETRKLQISDPRRFPGAVCRLSEALSSPEWLAALTEITGIQGLVPDANLQGGGMHLYGRGARLDVHVDFNRMSRLDLYRRLNILVFLNADWNEDWGGEIEFWDPEVKHRLHALLPRLNRCVLFETSEISFHGVPKVRCPSEISRQSFAAYYYTKEPMPDWDGSVHTTVFRARPNERLKRHVVMPLDSLWRAVRRKVRRVRRDGRQR